MDLLLWRHADALEGHPDATRELSPRGVKQALRMARWLDQHAPAELRVFSSPATRTRQTIESWGHPYEIHAALAVDSDPESLLAAIGWPELSAPTLVVGHQPVLGQVASLLLRGEVQDLSFKKGALWWFQRRQRNEEWQTVLKTVLNADLI